MEKKNRFLLEGSLYLIYNTRKVHNTNFSSVAVITPFD